MDKHNFCRAVNAITDLNDAGSRLCDMGFDPNCRILEDIWGAANRLVEVIETEMWDEDKNVEWWLEKKGESVVIVDGEKQVVSTVEKLYDLIMDAKKR